MTLTSENQVYHPALFDERLRVLTDPSLGVVRAAGAVGVYELVERPLADPGNSPIVIITGPSQSGKDSIVLSLLEGSGYSRVRTAVTRPRRDWEAPDAMVWMRPQNHDETPEDHLRYLIETHDLVEYDRHNDNVYGLPRQSLSEVTPGTIPIINTDTRAIVTLRRTLGDAHRIVSIMVSPNSSEALERRIGALGTNAQARLVAAQSYLGEAPGVIDYFIVNANNIDPDAAIWAAREKIVEILRREGIHRT